MSVGDIRGWGRGKMNAERRDHAQQVSDFEDHVKVEVLCADELVDPAVDAIQQAAHTGLAGDGKIIVLPVENAIRICTGERGESAL